MSIMAPKSRKLQHRNLPLLLMQARERVISYFRPILNAHGITEQQWRVVRVLLEVPALEPRQIGDLCAISSPSMAGVLERMEQAGYVSRRRVEHDQRRVLVSLTREARALAARMAPEIDATYDRLEEIMGDQLSVRLHEVLDGLLEQLPLPDMESETSTRTHAEVPPAMRARQRRSRRL
jgi:homoprotocatechuate degradation regulator HpaR